MNRSNTTESLLSTCPANCCEDAEGADVEEEEVRIFRREGKNGADLSHVDWERQLVAKNRKRDILFIRYAHADTRTRTHRIPASGIHTSSGLVCVYSSARVCVG